MELEIKNGTEPTEINVNGKRYKCVLIEEEKECGVFELREGEKYWHVSNGEVNFDTYNGDDYDLRLIATTPIFRTEAEAEHQLKKQRVEMKLRKLAGGYEFNTGEYEMNFYLHYDTNTKTIEAMPTAFHQPQGAVIFQTEEAAQHAIDTLGDELMVLFGGAA